MGIAELENEIKDIKACAYDLNRDYAKLTQRIEIVAEEMKKLKETSKEETIQIPTSEVNKEEVSSTETVQETSAVVTPIFNNTSESVVVIPQNEEVKEGVQDAVPGPQELDQTPLSPVGIEMDKDETKQVYMKKDDAQAKAIIINLKQGENLRTSKEEQKKEIFDTSIENEDKQVAGQAVVTPIVSSNVVAPVVETAEELSRQLEEHFEELNNAKNEEEANQKTSEIVEIQKKLEKVAKVA